ncbi:uncharacterized protein LOC101894094 isoform X3 [Musca domestica]|uniref:Uncharacterized protein LOC101894094 isoform X3 n=1 Tax=Musca domestica TaxID=7370 RepID=A0A1I8MDD2_MUSDO|nr:uncharacterized protein LOC101894094 isoform X3 [Musca domestica]
MEVHNFISTSNYNYNNPDDLDVFQDPRAYIIASLFMLAIYIIILLLILAWRKWYKPRNHSRDRQANVFTVQDENSRESRYNDIFFIEPNSAEAARIRAQLEKDDKDLPSYEEVMRMTSVTTPTTTSAAGVTGLTASNASVNTTETILAVPPYSEVDPIAAAAATSSSGNNTSSSASAARTSTAPPPMPAAMVSTATDITHQASSVV